MKKQNIIKSSEEYTKIINSGTSRRNKYYSLFYINKKYDANRFGITIPKKTGPAVVRNKTKRRIKNIIDHHKNTIQSCYDYVIIVKKGILELTYHDMEKELLKLIETIGD